MERLCYDVTRSTHARVSLFKASSFGAKLLLSRRSLLVPPPTRLKFSCPPPGFTEMKTFHFRCLGRSPKPELPHPERYFLKIMNFQQKMFSTWKVELGLLRIFSAHLTQQVFCLHHDSIQGTFYFIYGAVQFHFLYYTFVLTELAISNLSNTWNVKRLCHWQWNYVSFCQCL